MKTEYPPPVIPIAGIRQSASQKQRAAESRAEDSPPGSPKSTFPAYGCPANPFAIPAATGTSNFFPWYAITISPTQATSVTRFTRRATRK